MRMIIGGTLLAEAFSLVGEGGSVQSIGTAARQRQALTRGGLVSLHARSATAWAGR
jgi:hypothetical protein